MQFSRGCAKSCEILPASARPIPTGGFQRRIARLPARGPGLARLPPALRLRRLPGRRHGPGQNDSGAGAARSAPSSWRRNDEENRRRPSLVVVPRSLVFHWIDEAARFTPKLRILDHTGVARLKPGDHFDDYDLMLTTYGTLRRDVVHVQRHPIRLLHPRRSAGDQERRHAVGQGRAAAQGRSSPGDDRHAGRKPSGRAVEPVRVPQSRHARRRVRCFDAAPRRNPDAADAQMLAQALRPFILRRTKEQVLTSCRQKTEQTLYCELEARRSASSTTSCAITIARALLKNDRRRRPRASRRSRCSKRCCACGRRPAIPG